MWTRLSVLLFVHVSSLVGAGSASARTLMATRLPAASIEAEFALLSAPLAAEVAVSRISPEFALRS